MERYPSNVINGSIQFQITEGTLSWKVNFPNLKAFANIHRCSDTTTTKKAEFLGKKKPFDTQSNGAEVSSREIANNSSLLECNQAVITNSNILDLGIL